MPTHLKARVRHTWWVAIAMAGLLLVSQPRWSYGGWVHEGLEWLGYFGLILCVLGRTWSAAHIGGRKGQELVTTGPYSVVRNPLYVFSFIGVTGIGLLTGMITMTLAMIVLFAGYYRVVVRREEAVLIERFGLAYVEYLERVPRWWPRFSLLRDATEVTLKPVSLLYTIRDSAWFFVAFPAIEAIELLQQIGVIPVALRLP